MKTGYYINDKFILDTGKPMGVNVMFFGGHYDMNYWFDEKRFETRKEAQDFLATFDDLIEIEVSHPIPNRKYSPEEVAMFKKGRWVSAGDSLFLDDFS